MSDYLQYLRMKGLVLNENAVQGVRLGNSITLLLAHGVFYIENLEERKDFHRGWPPFCLLTLISLVILSCRLTKLWDLKDWKSDFLGYCQVVHSLWTFRKLVLLVEKVWSTLRLINWPNSVLLYLIYSCESMSSLLSLEAPHIHMRISSEINTPQIIYQN